MRGGRTVKSGVSLPADLREKLDALLKELGIPSRSRGIQEAVRQFIAQNEWRLNRGVVAGAVLVHYSHEAEGADSALTDAQHEHMDVIPASTHVHLSEEDCLLIVAVRGEIPRIKSLVSRLRSSPGVKQAVPVVISIE
ncbi:MAG: CopG family ribbon-helix-helix protein [Fervidicoccaceae archaeon]